jgi:hypothetical protein
VKHDQPFRSWLKNGLLVTAGVLCFVSIVTWVRSYWKADFVTAQQAHRCSRAESYLGIVRLWTTSDPRYAMRGSLSEKPGVQFSSHDANEGLGYFQWCGLAEFEFRFSRTLPGTTSGKIDGFDLTFPWWVLTAITGTVPGVWLLWRLKRFISPQPKPDNISFPMDVSPR